jgi:hypothetical protein
MKGIFTMKTMVFLLVLFILILVFARPLSDVIDEAVRRSILIQAESIAGSVNVLQASPHGTYQKIIFQKGECRLKLAPLQVNLSIGKTNAIKEIASHAEIKESSIDCSKEEDRAFYLKKCGNTVMLETKRECS